MKTMVRLGRRPFSILLIGGIVFAIGWDLVSSIHVAVQEGVFRKVSDFPRTVDTQTTVAVVPSDDASLPSPTPIFNPNLSYKQIEDMVRRAIELQGGLQGIVKPGDKVLIKPNIVDPKAPGTGEVTDVRVVKALVKILWEFANGNVVITIGEGSPRTTRYELPYSNMSSPQWKTKLWDTSGYPGLFTDPDLAGVKFDTLNLNGSPPNNPWQDLVLADVPGGGVAAPHKGKYWIHKAIQETNVYITCPVLKIHTPGITNALKNQIGLAACTKYGFNKLTGVPQLGYAVKLFHEKAWPYDWQDEEIVDLAALAHIDFCIADALVTLEKKKTVITQNGVITNQVRFNTILAGKDPVAVDVVGAKLIGINPDDVDHVCLAAQTGLGTDNPENIRVVGRSVDALKKRLRKQKDDTRLIFGRGNRKWLLSSAFPVAGVNDPINHEFIPGEAALEPQAGKNGWSDAVYFFDDRLDLGSYFGGTNDVVSYAFAYFYASKQQSAELWIGSDESLNVYLNHKPVYAYSGTRTYGNVQLLSERILVTIESGENALLVKSLQRSGYYNFALNICEVETDPELIGNRVEGLKFYPGPSQSTGMRNTTSPMLPGRIVLRQNYPNPFNAETSLRFDLPEAQHVDVSVVSLSGRRIRQLISGPMSAGSHRVRWNGRDGNGNEVPSGIYVCILRTDRNAVSRKLSLVR